MGASPAMPAEAAEELGQPAQLELLRRGEESFGNADHVVLEAVARQAESHEGGVVRPDRAVVIRHRVVARLALADRPDAPAREHPVAHHRVGDATGALGRRDAAHQTLPRVRRHDAARPLVAVERQRVRRRGRRTRSAASKDQAQALGVAAQGCARARRRPARPRARRRASWRHRRSPAPRRAPPGLRPACRRHGTSRRASPSSPGSARPRSVARAYSTNPSPSASPSRSIQASAASMCGHSRLMVSMSPVRW